MKKKVAIITLFILTLSLFAQNVGINSDGSNPHSSAMLEVKSTTKGFLAPRMTAAQRGDISSPATGLLVYQTDGTSGYYYYNGSSWTQIGAASGASQWATTGSDVYYNSGNVGIGTTSPNAKLDIRGAAGSYDFRISRDPASASDYYTYITAPGDTPGRAFIGVNDTNEGTSVLTMTADGKLGVNIGNEDPVGILQVTDNAGSLGNDKDITAEFMRLDGTYNPRLRVRHSIAGTDINHTYSSGASDLSFSVGDVEAMRIDGNRNVGIGTTNPGHKLTVKGPYSQPQMLVGNDGSNGIFFEADGSSSHYNWKISQQNQLDAGLTFAASTATGGTTFSSPVLALNQNGRVGIGTTSMNYTLHVNGSVAGTSAYNNLSDARLKKDVVGYENGLDKVMQLRPVTFNWKQDDYPKLKLDDRNHVGFIAQEVEDIVPQVVSTADDEMQTKSIAYSDLVPVLTKAIQEQQKIIEELEGRISKLEDKIKGE